VYIYIGFGHRSIEIISQTTSTPSPGCPGLHGFTHLARHELGYVLPFDPQTGTWCGAQLHGSPVCLYRDTALIVAGSQCFFVQVISPAKQLHVLQSISNVDPWSVTPNKIWSLYCFIQIYDIILLLYGDHIDADYIIFWLLIRWLSEWWHIKKRL